MGLFSPTKVSRPSGGGGLFRPSTPVKGKKERGLFELQAEAQSLQAEVESFGAPAIEQDRPGVFRTLLDLLSRPNYAIAGFAEEVLNETPSVTSGVKRALTEIFSGVGGLHGEKRAFGETLERLGVGTTTLADAFPALEGTWVGHFGSRGAAGLALDIVTDPLTYLTGGAARKALKIITAKGEIALSAKGAAEFNKILASTEVADEVAKLGLKADPFRLGASGIEMKKAEVAEKLFVKKFGATLPKDLVDPGGLRWMGQTLIRGESFGVAGDKVAAAIRVLPGGEFSLAQANRLGEGMKRGINEMFGAHGNLGMLPPELKAEAIRLHRNFRMASGAHRQRVRGILDHGNADIGVAPDLAKRYLREQKADAELGRKFYELREGTGAHVLTAGQREVFDDFVKLHDTLGQDLIDAGVFTKEELLTGRYFHHSYTPESLKALDQYHADLGTQFTGAIKETITKHRPFATFAEAESVSQEFNRIGRQSLHAGEMTALYPVLVPEYDLLKNFNRYIDQYADSIARQAWHEEAASRFARPIGNEFGDGVVTFDRNIHYRAVTGRGLAQAEADAVKKIVGTGRADFAAADKAMKGLSEDARHELVGQLLERSTSAANAAGVLSWARAKWGKYLPNLTPDVPPTLTDGDLYAKLYGSKARLVKRGGAIWGDREVMVPEFIAKDIEQVNSRILNTKGYGEFQRLIDGFDRVNNLFKWGNYTIWPASAARNVYSNVAQAFLDIGVGALDPKLHMETVAIMAGSDLARASLGGYTRGQLRSMARDFGVWVPGQTFIEGTGRVQLGKAGRKLANIVGSIENEARIQLWMGNIRRGIHPRQAADHVAEFLFNYGELSQFEREFMRRAIPFYTWTRKNIQLQAQALRRTPGRVVNQLKPFRGRTDENEQMVMWEAEGLKMRLDRDGKTVHMITGIDLPLRNLDTLWQGDFKRTGRNLMGMITPLVKTMPEILLNHDFFLGRSLTRTQSGAIGRLIDTVPTPGPVKDWLGYKKEVDDAGRPKYTFDGTRFTLLFRSWVFSRAVSTSDRQFREYMRDGGADWQKSALDVLTGLRRKSVDLDEQSMRRVSERTRQLEESLARRGVYGEFEKRYRPRDTGRPVEFR